MSPKSKAKVSTNNTHFAPERKRCTKKERLVAGVHRFSVENPGLLLADIISYQVGSPDVEENDMITVRRDGYFTQLAVVRHPFVEFAS